MAIRHLTRHLGRWAFLSTLAISLAGAQALAQAAEKPAAKTSAKPAAKAKSKKKLRQMQVAKGDNLPLFDRHGRLVIQSHSVLVLDQSNQSVLFEKNADAVVAIASITKLMTAMVVLDAHLPLDETLSVSEEDVDILKGTHSRLKVGTHMTRQEMLLLALMSSENRAASALSRHYPGGKPAFVLAMNAKAREIGLAETRFEDPTGLTSANVSSARDLVKMVAAAHNYPLIREFSTTSEKEMRIAGKQQMFRNTNQLVRSPGWEIGLSKTGFISEAGKCLVMQAWVNQKPTIIVLLDSWGRLTRVGDANRIKRWIESAALNGRGAAGATG